MLYFVHPVSLVTSSSAIVKHWLSNLHPTHGEKFNTLISNKLHCHHSVLFCMLVSRFPNTVFCFVRSFLFVCFLRCQCFMLERALQIFEYISNGCWCPNTRSYCFYGWLHEISVLKENPLLLLKCSYFGNYFVRKTSVFNCQTLLQVLCINDS